MTEFDRVLASGPEVRFSFISNRELRRVPLNWEHPRDEKGDIIPLFDH